MNVINYDAIKAKKVINILWESEYFPINKILAQKLGLIKSIIISEMLLSYEEMEDEEGTFQNAYILFYPKQLSKDIGVNVVNINKNIKVLENLGIISIQNIGFYPSKYYKINFDKIFEILNK